MRSSECAPMKQLAAAVLNSKSLEVLSDVPIKKLRQDKLTKLDFSTRGLGDTEAIVLAELIKFSAMLKKLNLFCNVIGDTGATALADALKVNAVTSINLRGNKISDAGAAALGEALKVNAVLKDLRLSST